MENVELFRMQVVDRTAQRDLFGGTITRCEAIKSAIMSLPFAEIRAGSVWRIGNVREFRKNGIYFCIGRTAKSKLSKYEKDSFILEPFTDEPFTHVVIDSEKQIVGIARNFRLGKPLHVSKSISHLLTQSRIAKESSTVFVLDQINDPTDFINKVQAAYSVTRLRIQFRPPNLFDVSRFLDASSQALDELRGSDGHGTFFGRDLDRNSVIESAQTAARTGREMSVRIRDSEESSSYIVELKDNPIVIEKESVDWNSDDFRSQLLDGLISAVSGLGQWRSE